MNEKIIIKSDKQSVKPLCCILTIIGLIFGFILVFISPEYHSAHDVDYFWTSIVPYYFSMSFLPIFLVAIFIYFLAEKSELIVTNKRCYGKTIFGKRVDLPLDSVSAISTSLLKGISISTSSGRITFYGISNRDDMHKSLNALLVERQNNPFTQPIIKQEIQNSNADELAKYKQLFDNGVITLEEYEAKKKQLLGL